MYVVFWATDRATGKKRKVWEIVPSGKVKAAQSRCSTIEVGLRENGGLWPLDEPAAEPTAVVTFEQYAASWLERRARPNVTPRVYDNYARTIRMYLSPALGTIPLDQLRRRQINDLVSDLAGRGLAKNTLRNVVIPLRKMLNDAVDDELLQANPAARVEIPRHAPVRRIQPPSDVELQRIIAKARPEARDAIVLMAALGLRRGEAFALRWKDIDFQGDVVYVRATNHRGQISDRTKTAAGERLVPLFDSARKVLTERKVRLPPQLKRPECFLFANGHGGAVDPGNFHRREWLRAVEAAKIGRTVRLHDLRHFSVTALDEQGMVGKLRSEIVGHADEGITNNVYTHIRRERVAAAAGDFDPLRAVSW